MIEHISSAGKYIEKLIDFGFDYGPKLIGAIIVLTVGLWISNLLTKSVGRSLLKTNIDQSLVPFLKNLTNLITKILVIMTVLGIIGIQMTSLIAMLSSFAFVLSATWIFHMFKLLFFNGHMV